ncbi:MAG: hypothetical protein K0B81_02090 [Candidatus Cloacimonetes bacterium]|nr:hypothetical protein [Candidatus Cloacimonadota bacterium]
MTYVIFDDRFTENFYPLTLNRSQGDLRVGILKLRQRIAAYLEIENPPLIISSRLESLYRYRHPNRQINSIKSGETLFINSRLKIDDDWVKRIHDLPENSVYADDNCFLVARLKVEGQDLTAENCDSLFDKLNNISLNTGNCWQYIWELISSNAEYIKRDFEDFFYDQDNFYETEMGVTILNPYNVWIGEGTEMKPGVVIDASNGPVVIDEGVNILPNAVIIGPVYIGKRSVIKSGAKIYAGTSIGPVCKIGGEVEATIFQGYSNKQHDGFLGHSYLGEWINLGADTNNSDLKNNYKPIKSYFYPWNKKIETGCQFLGVVIGDHTKTGINCTINTGAVIGLGCNLYGSKLITDYIPSYSWGSANDLIPYQMVSFLETAQIVKKRRDLPLTDAEIELFKQIQNQK